MRTGARPVLAGYWAGLALTAVIAAAAAFPAFRAVALWVLQAPFALAGAVLPGRDLHADGAAFAAFLGVVAWAAVPLAALPPLAALSRLAPWPKAARLIQAAAKRVADAIDAVTGFIGGVASWASLALVIVVAVIVLERYVFGLGFTKLQELVVYLHAGVFLLASAAALKADGHVRVDLLYSKLTGRQKALVDFSGAYLLLLPVCLVILATSGGMVDLAWRVREGSVDVDGLPLVFALKTLIPVFAVLMIAQGLSMACRAGLEIAGAAAPHAPFHEPTI